MIADLVGGFHSHEDHVVQSIDHKWAEGDTRGMKDPFESGARLSSRAELNMHQFLGPARYDVHLRSDVCPVYVFFAVN